MVEDAGAKLLIADESLTELLPDYKGPVLLIKDIPSLPAGKYKAPDISPEDCSRKPVSGTASAGAGA